VSGAKQDLANYNLCNTFIAIEGDTLANMRSEEKQITIISALAEDSGIRQIERMTGGRVGDVG
jgi:hypothetical protein